MNSPIIPSGNNTLRQRDEAADRIIRQLRGGAREAILALSQAQGLKPERAWGHSTYTLKDWVAVGGLLVKAQLDEPIRRALAKLARPDPDDFYFQVHMHRDGDPEGEGSWLESSSGYVEFFEMPMHDTRLTRVLGVTVFTQYLRDAASSLAKLNPENDVPYAAIADLARAEGPRRWQDALEVAAEQRYPIPDQLLGAVQAAFAETSPN